MKNPQNPIMSVGLHYCWAIPDRSGMAGHLSPVLKVLIWTILVLLFSAPAAVAYLTYVETHRDGENGVDGLESAYDIVVSPDNKHVYVAGYHDDALALFSRDTNSGALTFVEAVWDGVDGVNGLNRATSVCVSPDGSHVYAAGTGDDAVAVFTRDTTTGILTFAEQKKKGDSDSGGTIMGMDGPTSVTVSPDNAHVYITSTYDDYLVVFSRDAATGGLTFVEEITGITGLAAPRKVVVSPDGKHIYVASEADALVVFGRDEATGGATHVQTIENDAGVDFALDSVWGIIVSPDNSHVYTAATHSDAVAVFSRDTDTGQLTFVEKKADGDTDDGGIVDGVDVARSVCFSPDGKFLFVAGSGDKAVAVFHRDPGTGTLTWEAAKKDGDNDAGGTIEGLNRIKAVTVSPDGLHLYAATFQNEDAVTVFEVGPITTPPGETGHYRLAFLSSALTDGAGTDIDTYNTFVKNLADAHPELAALDTTWTAVVSTAAVDAIDNTATKGIGVPIYRMDGVKIAGNYGDLWDAGIDAALDVYENGVKRQTGDPAEQVYTGTGTDGRALPGSTLGSLYPEIGSSEDTDSNWVDSTSSEDKQVEYRIYAISGVLPAPAVPDAPIIGTATAGNGQATVTFTGPEADNGSEVTTYTAISDPGGITADGTESPITVTGLANGTTYRFTVTATNAVGTGAASGESNTVLYTEPQPDAGGDGGAGQTPQPVYTWYADADGDGYGDPGTSENAVFAPSGYVSDNSDCDDTDGTVFPGATETAGDGIDQDCDGEDPAIWYLDSDLDGFGSASKTVESVLQPIGYTDNDGDCDNGNPDVYPGAPETANDGIDQDCDGKDHVTWYLDADQDGYGDPLTSLDAPDPPVGYVSGSTDCDDGDKTIFPGAVEIAGDLKDQDCDGQDAPLAFKGTLEADPASGLAPAAISFITLVAQGSSPFTFEYDFGDGSQPVTTTDIVSHTFHAKGTYTVTVTVTDAAGASTDLSVIIEVIDQDGLDDLTSQLIVDADQVDQAQKAEELPGILADAQEVIDKSLTAVSSADPEIKKDIEETVRDEAGDLISGTQAKISGFIDSGQITPDDMEKTIAGVGDVVSNMVNNDVAIKETTLTDLGTISGDIFSASADLLLKKESLDPGQLDGIKTDTTKAQEFFTANPHLLDDVVEASGIEIDMTTGFDAEKIQEVGADQGLDEQQTAGLFKAVEPTPDVDKAVALDKDASKTIAEIAVEIVDTHYAGKTLAQYTLEPVTKSLLIEFSDNTYISFLIDGVSIVGDFAPQGPSFMPDGSILGVKDTYAISFIPYPASPFDLTAELLKLGMDPTLTSSGGTTATLSDTTTFSAGVGWEAFSNNTFNTLTTSFSVVGGQDPSAEAYSLLVTYDTGLSQLIPPSIHAMDTFLVVLNATVPNDYTIDPNSGVVRIGTLKFKPDYVFTSMDLIGYSGIQAGGGIVYNNKIGIEFQDYNQDGLIDAGLYSGSPKGFQVLYGISG